MITHDSHGGHSDIYDYIDGNASRIGDAEERIGKLEARISELEDTVREHQVAVPHAESQA